MSAENMTEADQMALWHNLASGAESGMDFSSRWFQDPLNISTIQTTKIIPAELNAYLYQMENNIAGFADMMGNSTVAATFRESAAARKTAMNTLMYNATEGGCCCCFLPCSGCVFSCTTCLHAAASWNDLYNKLSRHVICVEWMYKCVV